MVNNKFFKASKSLTISKLLEITDSSLVDKNDKVLDQSINNVSSLGEAEEGDICFLTSKLFLKDLNNTKASFCFIREKHLDLTPKSVTPIISKDPYGAFLKIVKYMFPEEEYAGSISDKAIIDKSAKVAENCTIEPNVVICEGVELGPNTFIGANSYIGKNVTIGKNCVIKQNVVIINAIIGNNVIIKPSANIGQRGFGFYTEKGIHKEIKHVGYVEIGNDVEIGASTCIDQSSFNATKIGDGTKIDNLVQVGHNVQMGKGCLIAGKAGFAGSCELGDYVSVGARGGVSNHIKIGNHSIIRPLSSVMKDLKPNSDVIGALPAMPLYKWSGLIKFLLKGIR